MAVILPDRVLERSIDVSTVRQLEGEKNDDVLGRGTSAAFMSDCAFSFPHCFTLDLALDLLFCEAETS